MLRNADDFYVGSPMHSPKSWCGEFAQVVHCERCTTFDDRNLLHDKAENVPQPGWIGKHYPRTRLLLVGQNPGIPKTLAGADLPYTKALRAMARDPSEENYQALTAVLRGFIPQWPVHGKYFPLSDCDLSLEDIAYCNVVRCRTQGDSPPGTRLVANCVSQHFPHWLALLQPRAVVFIGKWAAVRGGPAVAAAGIPYTFMNRQRSLSSAERAENRSAVIQFVRASAD